jgi:phage FluMu protein gp41
MTERAAPTTGERGSDLLLRHCDALTNVERPRAYERLEELVGDDLARMLVTALAPRREALAA